MKRRAIILILLSLGAFVSAAENKKPAAPVPDSFILGRHTFIDIGPPFNFYEVLSVRAGATGTFVERITVTPPGDPCTQPASVEVANVALSIPVSGLLGGSNPCAIPEKALRKELKRCENCLVFSGAEITMSVQCGTQTRLIRMNILDRDMFDRAPRTPEHTSWTMALLARLDQALGPGVLERPIFSLEGSQPERSEARSASLDDLRRGAFDVLFKDAPDKPSEIYLKAQNALPPPPTVTLARISPVRPLSESLPKYPPLARAARVSGVVSFTLDVTSGGAVDKFQVISGHPLLRNAVEAEVTKWTFSTDATGQSIQGAIEFSINCSLKP
jgi:hypothetical protein